MEKMKIGVLCPSEIAFRRCVPALQKSSYFEYAGVAVAGAGEWFGEPSGEQVAAEQAKAQKFVASYGGKIFAGYRELLSDPEVGAVYIPLPPALHFRWAKLALELGKNVLLEKPFCTNVQDTEELLNLAAGKGLAVHENYMFLYHSQLAEIKKMLGAGELGELRLMRMAFGFPKRAANDFRYNQELGGGALLDCGGYPVRLALELLGDTVEVAQACLVQPMGYEVDLYGNAVLQNEAGVIAQIAFGMDNAYKCELEIWGSKTSVIAPRIFTAGADFEPELIIRTSSDEKKMKLPADEQFLHSIERFADKIKSNNITDAAKILKQAQLVEKITRFVK